MIRMYRMDKKERVQLVFVCTRPHFIWTRNVVSDLPHVPGNNYIGHPEPFRQQPPWPRSDVVPAASHEIARPSQPKPCGWFFRRKGLPGPQLRAADLSPLSDWRMSLANQRPRTKTPSLTVNKVWTNHVAVVVSETTGNRFGALQIQSWVRTHVVFVYFAWLSGRSELSPREKSMFLPKRKAWFGVETLKRFEPIFLWEMTLQKKKLIIIIIWFGVKIVMRFEPIFLWIMAL